ncbi:MAG: type I-E CRISPR-associated protein Cse1/CasA [Gammaproteobacteria bacterium]
MNLVTEPWIPVVGIDGGYRLASLEQVFSEGWEFADLAVRPHERIALMRLLICIAQAALDGPAEYYDDWVNAPAQLPQAGKRYLNQWGYAFSLFDSTKPFLQVSWPIKNHDSGKPISKLDCALAAGNNSTLFDHEGLAADKRKFSIELLASMLVTFQNFAQGGGVSSAIWIDKPKNFADGPCKPSSMLHAFIRRKTVCDTICANLLTKEAVSQHFNKPIAQCWGKPIWEMMPASFEDGPKILNATRTYLGRLVPLARLVRLNAQGQFMLLASGLEYPRFPECPREASATEVIRNDKRKLLSAGAKATWRELSALVVSRGQDEAGGALTLANIPDNEEFDLWVGALLIDPRKTAEVLDTVESVFHIPANMRTDNGRAAYAAEVEWAEGISRKLSWAVETYREQTDGGWERRIKMAGPKRNELRGKLHATATRHYWTAVEKLRPLLMKHVEAIGTTSEAVQQTRNEWLKAIHGAAREAYRLACGQDTPRQMRAFALGWSKLFAKPKTESEQPEELETEKTEA